MSVGLALLFYTSLFLTVYHSLLLVQLTLDNAGSISLNIVKMPFRLLRALLFLYSPRKIRFCVLRWWLSAIGIAASIVIWVHSN